MQSCQAGKRKRENLLDNHVKIYTELKEVPVVDRRDDAFQFEFITIDDSVSIYMLRKGAGVPMVLLNGGPGNSCHSFVPYFDRATEFCELILYDPRGVGRSDWIPGEGYSTAQLIEDLEKIRETLGIAEWVVAGWSFGGLAAQHYLLKHPERVLGMVLINSAYSTDYEFSDASYPDHLSQRERERIREIYSIEGNKVVPVHSDHVDLGTLRTMVYNGYLNGDWKRQFFCKPTKEEMAAVARFEWIHDKDYNQSVAADGYATDLSGKFKDLDIPVLMFYGRHDMTFSSELPARMKKEFTNATLHVFEKSSHNPFKEQPDRFFSEVDSFMQKFSRD